MQKTLDKKKLATIEVDRIEEIRERTMSDDLQVRAEPGELSVGDFVRWNSSGGTAEGRIDRIERDGTINVPDSDFTVNGDEDDPAALITVYRETDEGNEATDVQVGHRREVEVPVGRVLDGEAGHDHVARLEDLDDARAREPGTNA